MTTLKINIEPKSKLTLKDLKIGDFFYFTCLESIPNGLRLIIRDGDDSNFILKVLNVYSGEYYLCSSYSPDSEVQKVDTVTIHIKL